MEDIQAGAGEGTMIKSTFFPSNFTNNIKVLTNYYTQPVRIVPSTGQQNLGPNDELIITMPPASVIDLRTFQLFFNAEITGTTAATQPCGFPKHIASMIQTLSIYINGVCVQHIDDYNVLYNIFKDMYGYGEQEGKQSISTNADPSVRLNMNDAGVVARTNLVNDAPVIAGATDANVARNTYCIKDWVGFLGSCRPSILDTNLFGVFEVRIRLAPDAVLWKNVAAANPSYQISNLYAYVNRIDWKSPTYYSLFDALLSSGGSLNMPYNNYRRHTGNALVGSKTNIMRFTESTQSLAKVIWTYRTAGANTIGALQLGNDAIILGTNVAQVAAAYAQAEVNAIVDRLNASTITSAVIGINDANFQTFLRKNIGPLYNSSVYFRRNGLGLGSTNGIYAGGSCQLEVNSQLIPSYPLTLPQVYEETLKAFNLLNSDKGIHPAMKDLSHYEKDFFVGAFALSHFNNNDSEYLISGFNSQASSIQLALHVTNHRGANAAQSATPIVYTEMNAILKVGAGRQVMPIF